MDNEYTKGQVIRSPGCIIDIGPPSFWLHYGKQKWLTQWHHWFGPTHLNARTGDPRDKQPSEKSMFWNVAIWWKNQGAKVVDGVGQWKMPPRKTIRYRKVGRHRIIVHEHESGPDVFEENDGWIDIWDGKELGS